MVSAHILTHGDLDGLVSGIFLLQALGSDTPFCIANGDKLARELQTLLTRNDLPRAVYIADIPLAVDKKPAVVAAMTALHARGCPIYLYDHHFGWNVTDVRPLCTTYIVDTNRTTAAVLIWQHLLRRDPLACHWLTVLSQKDSSGDPAIREDFQLLLALLQPCHWDQTSRILPALARGDLTDADRHLLVNWYQTVYLSQMDKIGEVVEIMPTAKGLRIAWVDVRDYQELINITRAIIDRYRVDLVATIIPNGIILGGPGIDRGPDLSPLHGTHEYQGYSFTIAGHRSPVRISPVTSKVTEEFLRAIKSFLREKI